MVSDSRIALDFEGVCADTHSVTYDASDLLDPSDDDAATWEFDSDERLAEFMDVSTQICTEQIEEVPPCDPELADHVSLLRESHTVDILTNRHGVDDQIQAWLTAHGVEVDGFQANPAGTNKVGFEKNNTNPNGYDFFIDDNPNLAYEVDRLFLVDQAWNRAVDDDDDHVIRVGDNGTGALVDVVNELYAGPIR